MNTRLPKLDRFIIDSLSGLSKRCDWFIHGNEYINIVNTQTPKFIFLNARKGDIGMQYLVDEILPTISSNFVLIIASEEYIRSESAGLVIGALLLHKLRVPIP
jgi:hypothetical protein